MHINGFLGLWLHHVPAMFKAKRLPILARKHYFFLDQQRYHVIAILVSIQRTMYCVLFKIAPQLSTVIIKAQDT